MKKKLYIETSVWNQLEQRERPDFKEITEKFMRAVQTGMYDVYVSDYVFLELEECHESKRNLLLNWIEKAGPTVLKADEECEILMKKYFDAGVLSPVKANKYYDAAHVAICSTNSIEYLLTFNYKHMLKIKKIEGFKGVNALNGYGEVKLTTPDLFIPEED